MNKYSVKIMVNGHEWAWVDIDAKNATCAERKAVEWARSFMDSKYRIGAVAHSRR